MSSEQQNLADQLIAADSQSIDRLDSEQIFKAVLDREIAFEQNVRRVAIFAWSVTLVCIVLAGVCTFVVRNMGGEIADIARVCLLVAGATGIIALLVSLLVTVAWLFRSRTASLAAIERRLASLESSFRSMNERRSRPD